MTSGPAATGFAVELAPDSFRWRYLLGFARQEQGEFAAAEADFDAALRLDATRPNALLRREMQLFPDWLLGEHLGLVLSAGQRAMLDETFALLAIEPNDPVLAAARRRHAEISAAATREAVASGDERLATAVTMLAEARSASSRWKIRRPSDTIEAGVAAMEELGAPVRAVECDIRDPDAIGWSVSVRTCS